MPPQNIISFNVLVALWEKKIDKTLEKVYVPEDQVLQNIKGNINLLLPLLSHNVKLLCY